MLTTVNVCELPAPPEFVWPFYTDPAQWPLWAADIESACVDGPLRVGARGRCKYRLLPEGNFRITAFEAPHSFTLDWEMLATHVVFQHELTPVGAHGCHIRERIDFRGFLAPILGLLERPRIRTHWPRSMDCLGAFALESYLKARDDLVASIAVPVVPPTRVPVAPATSVLLVGWIRRGRRQGRRPARSGNAAN